MTTEVGGEYLALARKYRPQNFEDVVGQEHVLKALAHSIDTNRTHHAYLLTGTRGIGKTTIARIFAKALECEKGVSSHPCGECDACKAIIAGVFPDVVEIDAASQTKVDDTRQLLENTQYPPLKARYKIYIIDEVHMLSTSSFNALLKTLEEPPAYVKFILATTDPHKIPSTVLSRCLQFQLRALSLDEISHQLQKVCGLENVKYSQEAIQALARAARGSMRDALSLCDQAIALGHGELEAATVYSMLGTIGDVLITDILGLLSTPPAAQAASAAQAAPVAPTADALDLGAVLKKIREKSPNYKSLLDELLLVFHDLAMYQMLGANTHLEVFSFSTSMLDSFARKFDPQQIQLYYQIVLEGLQEYPYATDGRAAFEMTLLRLLAFTPLKKKLFRGENQLTVEVDLLGALVAQIRRTTSPEQQARFAASGQADFALASVVAGGVMPTAAGSAQMPLSSKRMKENFLNFDVEGALGDYWPQNRRQNASGATGTSAAAAPTCSSDYPRLSSALPLSTSQRGTMRATAATKQGAIAGADSSILVNHDMPHWSQRDVVANKSMPDKAELKQKLNQLLPQKHTVDVSELLAASRAQVPQAQYSASVTANVAAAVAVPVTAESFAHPQSVTVANSYPSSSLGAPRTSYPDSKIECFVSMEQHLQHLLTVIQERPQDALAEAVHLCHKLRMNEKQRAQFMGVAQSLIQKHQALQRQHQATATPSQPLQGQAQVSSAVQGTRPNNAFYDAGSGVQLATPTFTGLTPTAMEGANAFAYPNVNLGAGRGPEGVSEQITLASPQERAVAAAISAQSQAHEAWGQDNNAALAYGADAVVDISAVNAAEAQAARAAAQAAAAQAAAQAAAAQAAQTGSASANSADQDTYSGHKKSSSWLNEDPNAFAVFQHGSDIRSDVIDQELARVERRQQELDAAEMQHMQQLLPQMESYFNFLDEISEQLRTEAIKSYKDQERSDSSKKLEDTNTALGKLATPRFRDIKVSEQDLAAEAQGAAATAATPAASAAATAAAGAGAVSDVDDVLQQQTTTGYDVNDPRHLGAQMVSSISLAANDPSIDPVDAMKGGPSVGAANAAAAASALQPVSKSDQLAPAVDLGATAAGVAPMPATAAPKAPETLQVVAASAVQPDRCAVDLHAPAAQGDQVVSSAMPAASAAATAPVAAGAASTAGVGAVVSLAPQAHDQSFTAPQGAVQKVDGTVDTTAQDQALAAMAANMAQTHAAKRQARNSQELSALKQQEADAALNALDMMTQHIDEQNHLLEQHGAAAWYAIHDTLAVGNRNLKVHLAKRPKLAVSSVHNFLADSSSDQAPRRIRLFNPPLADNCGMGNVSLVELQQDQQLMAQILSQEQACSENLRLRMAAQTPQHETLAPEQVVVKLRDPQATAAAAQPLATGQLLSIVSMIPHAKLPADLAMRTAQMANNASNAANMALPQGNAQQVVPSRGYQYRGPQLPEVPDYIKEAQESFNDSYGVDAAALPAAPAAPAVAAAPAVSAVAAAPAVAAAENPASQPSPAVPMNAAMDSNAAIAGRVVQAPAAAAAPAPALAGEDQGSDDDDYGANGGGAGFGDAGFGGGGGGAMEGINFDSNEPGDDDDYGGSFSGNVELDLGSSFDEPSGGVIGVPESDLEYEAASEPEEAWAAGGNTGSAVALRSGHWSNISGKKRLNYEDYLPQVAEQDQWYHLIVQAFAETPMLQAMLTNVERVLDPQDANHWILRVDQHEDLSLFSEISAMSLRGGSHNAHGGGLWQMVQERLEAVCGHALRIDIENTDSIPENAPLRLAQRLEEQAKEQARQELSQVQGLTSLLSQLNENMQSVSIEIYQDQVPATVEKKP